MEKLSVIQIEPKLYQENKSIIELTDEAYTRLHQRAEKESCSAFRVALVGGGCGGYKYLFDYCRSLEPGDVTIDYGQISLVIDKQSAPYLRGMTLDYVIEGLNEEFRFINPNATYSCGCGESVGF